MMYPRHKAWSLFLATLLCLLTTPLLGAQSKAKPSNDEEATRQLETLLIELGRLPEGAWKKRVGALQARISAEESLVAKAESEVVKVQARAKRHAAVAAKYRAELARLAKIKPLLVKMTMLHPKPKKAKAAVAKAPAKKKVAVAKPAAAKKTRAKNVPAKKAPAKKAVAKKAPAKKALAKKAPAKKAPAKKAVAKKASAKKAPTKKAAPKKSPAKKVAAPKSKAKAAPSKSSAKGGPKATKPKLEKLLTWAQVEPIFEEHCMSCHETGDAEGGLDLTSYATLRAGGGSGKTLVPGNVDGSRLYLLVSHKEKPTMPPDEPRIDKALIETIRTWIAQGAPETEAAASMLAKKRVQAQVLAKKQADERAKKALARVASAPMPESVPGLDRVMTEQAVGAKTIATSPLAPVVAVPGYGQVLLHHADTNAVLGALPFAFGEIEVLRFTADGKRLLAAGGQVGRKGGAVLYDVKTGAVLRRIEAGFDSVLAADATAEMIALGGPRKRVDVYSVEDGNRLYRVTHDEWVLAIDFDDAGKLLATADRSGKVAVTEAATGRNVHDITSHKTAVNAVAFAPGAGLLATAGEDRSVRLWRMEDGRQLWSKTSHRGPVLSLAWRSPAVLVSGSADGVVRGWKTSGAASGKAKTVGEWVYGLACSSSGKRLFAGDWSGRISVFDVKTGKLVHRFSPTLASQ